MIRVTIQGVGEFEINSEKLQELLNWLAQNRVVQTSVSEQTKASFQGQRLING